MYEKGFSPPVAKETETVKPTPSLFPFPSPLQQHQPF
jgi:hypothetical protein